MTLLISLSLVGCGGSKSETGKTAGNEAQGSLTIVGSTAMQPMVEEAATQFMAKNTGAQVVVQGGGSGTGLTQVSQGAAQIGNSDVFAEEKEGIDATQLKDHKVAVVGIVAAINPQANVKELTGQQLIDVFTGKVTNWKQVGGADVKVTLVNRPKGSGTRATFKKYALKDAEEAAGIEQDSSGTVKKIINETPGAIGYFALSYVDDKTVAIKLDGVEPTKENITNGKYPVWAYEHMYTKGEPTGLTKTFIDYVLSPDVQNTIVPKLAYIPVGDMKVSR
ncbi:MAG TPA: phosphate ABC transporter substrate-binding protein [Bacillota bacterium]|nr:phosphate ABC transporter substrate-binding protein [Bacillota bacterium]